MKLEIIDVMICEWDADTKCIIVSPADGWKVNVNHLISEAHASMVTMEKMDPDYSHLIGKWVKYWLAGFEDIPEYGKWFRVNDVKWGEEDLRVYVDGWSHDDGTTNEVWKKIDEHSCCFDLTDARDYNPEHRGYLIEENPNYHPSHPETKYIFHNTNNCDQPSGNAETVEICRELIDDIIDKSDNPDEKPETEKEILDRTFSHEYTNHDNWSIQHSMIDGTLLVRTHGKSNEAKPEPKPHQLKEYDAVECNAEERAEIIKIADECGVPVYNETRTPKDLYPNMSLNDGILDGLRSRDKCVKTWIWHTVPDFIAKIRGTYVEVNVSEHKHESA